MLAGATAGWQPPSCRHGAARQGHPGGCRWCCVKPWGWHAHGAGLTDTPLAWPFQEMAHILKVSRRQNSWVPCLWVLIMAFCTHLLMHAWLESGVRMGEHGWALALAASAAFDAGGCGR